jgi:hypothetical protein
MRQDEPKEEPWHGEAVELLSNFNQFSEEHRAIIGAVSASGDFAKFAAAVMSNAIGRRVEVTTAPNSLIADVWEGIRKSSLTLIREPVPDHSLIDEVEARLSWYASDYDHDHPALEDILRDLLPGHEIEIDFPFGRLISVDITGPRVNGKFQR